MGTFQSLRCKKAPFLLKRKAAKRYLILEKRKHFLLQIVVATLGKKVPKSITDLMMINVLEVKNCKPIKLIDIGTKAKSCFYEVIYLCLGFVISVGNVPSYFLILLILSYLVLYFTEKCPIMSYIFKKKCTIFLYSWTDFGVRGLIDFIFHILLIKVQLLSFCCCFYFKICEIR